MSNRRPSGEGLLRQEKKGQWEGRIVVGHKENGTPIFRYVYGKTQKEAIEKLHIKLDEFHDVELSESSRMTLGAWLEQWLIRMQGSVRESTFSTYRMYIRSYIKPRIGDKPIAFLTTTDMQRFYNALRKNGRLHNQARYGSGLSGSTIARIHSTLHEALDMAVTEHLLSQNPTNGTTVPKAEKREMQVLNDAQLQTFMEAIERYQPWSDFFYTAITTGLRRGEICGLKWSDFDAASSKLSINRSITVKHNKVIEGETKTGKSKRSFYLPISTANILRQRKRSADSEWIFANPLKPSLPVAPNAAYTKLKAILKQASLPNLRFHDLRHTFATHALSSGVDAKTLSEILGHKNASFTLDTYTHMTTDMQHNSAEIVGNMMNDIFVEVLSA